ncbi:murein hydrolase activator EnvC family protein [Gracilimonas tropica]|uniref:murein hydrolase activator EnvC family protein n=1 Tax=Gracilimonas tropica TaxID=454600 RepID=UPI00037F0FC9|nr:peptidoglycan DD-metalloendopeptidase family protein [Gracilimonas tropica]
MKNSFFLKTGFIIITALILSSNVWAQNLTYEEKREQLLKRQENTRAEINVLEARIKNYQQRISQAEERYDKSFEQFQSLNNLIALQDDKIQNLQQEQKQIEAEIQLTEKEIELREDELEHLIENYKEIMLYAYKNSRTGNLELLLTSNSINQMLVRANYLKRFEEQRAKQAETIRENRRELDQVKVNLQDSYEKNRQVIGEIRDEKEELGQQRQQQERTVEQIKQERSTWLAELRKTREEKENLENVLDRWIEEEESVLEADKIRKQRLAEARNIADAQRRSEEVAKYSKPITRASFVSDEVLMAHEQLFGQAKGDLIWPVNSTTIAKQFGRVRNPLYGTVTEHPGIDIVAEPQSPVKAVSPGYVFRIQPLPGYGDVVFMKHGSYYTAYGNLSRIDVEVGSVLEEGEQLGLSGTSQSELGEVVFFLVRRGNENLNPENWLSSR